MSVHEPRPDCATKSHQMPCSLADVPISLIGEAAKWFELKRQSDTIVLRPKQPLPRRCTIRPAALFANKRGYPDLKTVMGRMMFQSGTTEEQLYRPFTRDPDLTLREIFIPIETMPEDEWPTSRERWTNFETVAQRLLSTVEIPWSGFAERDLDELTNFVIWPNLFEGCVLHALAQWRAHLGECVIEVGSLRGRSATVLATALRGVESDARIISVDPHAEEPHNREHVQLALRQIGEERRLIQITSPSNQAHKLLRPAVASLVFIDGDHSYQQVLADFENYRGLVAPGGCLAFHDYGFGAHNGLPEFDPGVGRTVREHVLTAPDFEPVLLAHSLFVAKRIG